MRNQIFKNEIFCIQQSIAGKKCYFFCKNDPIALKKYFYLENDHHYANQDVILIENNNGNHEENLEDKEIFSITIKEFNQDF